MEIKEQVLIDATDYEAVCELCRTHEKISNDEPEKLRGIIRKIAFKLHVKNFSLNYQNKR